MAGELPQPTRDQIVAAKARAMFSHLQGEHINGPEHPSFAEVIPTFLANVIAVRANSERENGDAIRPFNFIETNLLNDWRQEQEIQMGLRQRPAFSQEQMIKQAIEIFGGAEGFKLIESTLRKLRIHIPENSALNTFMSAVTTEALIHILVHEKNQIGRVLAQVATEYNPEGLNRQLNALAENMTR